MSDFWRYVSYIFPSTHGIQGYIKINSAAADLPQVRFEYISLWIQTGIYFILATMTLRYTVRKGTGD
jgi:ABC-2 type transport system permease protein